MTLLGYDPMAESFLITNPHLVSACDLRLPGLQFRATELRAFYSFAWLTSYVGH